MEKIRAVRTSSIALRGDYERDVLETVRLSLACIFAAPQILILDAAIPVYFVANVDSVDQVETRRYQNISEIVGDSERFSRWERLQS